MAIKLSERGPIHQTRDDALSAQAGPYCVNVTNEVAQLEAENTALKRESKNWEDAYYQLNQQYCDDVATIKRYVKHDNQCFKNQALRDLGVGGRLASCTCGLDALLSAKEPNP